MMPCFCKHPVELCDHLFREYDNRRVLPGEPQLEAGSRCAAEQKANQVPVKRRQLRQISIDELLN